MDANRYFANLQGANKPKTGFNQFRANLAAGLRFRRFRRRLASGVFFFLTYEGTRASRPDGAAFVDVPDPDWLQGDFRTQLRSDLIRGTNFPVGTVFQPRESGARFRRKHYWRRAVPEQSVPPSLWAKNTPGFLKVINQLGVLPSGTPIRGQPDVVRVPYQDTYNFSKNAKVLRVDYKGQRQTKFLSPLGGRAQSEQTGLGIFATTRPGISGIPQKAGCQLVVEPDQHLSLDVTNRRSLPITT